MEREDAVELIRSFPLAEYCEALLDHLSPSVRITVIDEIKEGGPPGLSHFGGQPSLPANMKWPEWDKILTKQVSAGCGATWDECIFGLGNRTSRQQILEKAGRSCSAADTSGA